MRTANNWDTWLAEYDQAATDAETLGVSELIALIDVKNDFVEAVKKIAPSWCTTFKQIGLHTPTVTRKDTIRLFRDEMKTSHPLKARAAKAAFGAGAPTLNGEEDPNAEAPAERGRGKRKAQQQSKAQDNRRKCLACEQLSHQLPNCYYAFPERAGDWFTPRDHIAALVKNRMENNVELQEEMRKAKRPRSQQPPVKRSTSTPHSTVESS